MPRLVICLREQLFAPSRFAAMPSPTHSSSDALILPDTQSDPTPIASPLHPPLTSADNSAALSDLTIRTTRATDQLAVRALHERVFGPGRFAKSAYRVREDTPEMSSVCQVAFLGEALVGSVRMTPVCIGGAGGALLLGPMAVEREHANKGIGVALLNAQAIVARATGYRLIVLIGDSAYYRRAGFWPVPAGRIIFPGPADPARVLALELTPDALGGFGGKITADVTADVGRNEEAV